MNDFLQSLRSRPVEKHRSPMTRKSYDTAFNNPNHRYPSDMGYSNSGSPYLNRASQPFYREDRTPSKTISSSGLHAAIKGLSAHIESLGDHQKSLINAHEKTVTMLERQVIAMEKILNHLNIPSK